MGVSQLGNIGRTERRARYVASFAFLVMALAFAVLALARDADAAWRLLLFIPFLLSAHYFYEARTNSCVLKAELGRETPPGRLTSLLGQKMKDSNAARRLKNISRRGQGKALLLAAAVTMVFVALPV